MRSVAPSLAAIALLFGALVAPPAAGQIGQSVPSVEESATAPPAVGEEADAWLTDFRFANGAHLDRLRMHYRTMGTPVRDSAGRIVNAAVLLHGTAKSGDVFLSQEFREHLFAADAPLDLRRFYVILPDALGAGGSSRPSDGLRGAFPAYGYGDQVAALHAMLRQIGVERPRVVIGASMGCMHAWLLATDYPDFARALMPISCAPRQIGGVNRMVRRLAADAIRRDPDWRGGHYDRQPVNGLRAGIGALMISSYGLASPLGERLSTRAEADAFLERQLDSQVAGADANDFLFQVEASTDYDPEPRTDRITAPLTAVNSARDLLYPADTGTRPPFGKAGGPMFVLVPDPEGYGHFISYHPAVWKGELAALLRASAAE